MSALALPLRIGANGQFVRTDATSALLQLIAVIVQTTPGTWPHAPWFGLQPMWESANSQVEEHPVLADALNAALRNLGIDWASVASVRAAAPDGSGARQFDITLRTSTGAVAHGRVGG